mgnify:CR=1 FL=1
MTNEDKAKMEERIREAMLKYPSLSREQLRIIYTEHWRWEQLFKEVYELRALVNQLFELLTTDKPRKS